MRKLFAGLVCFCVAGACARSAVAPSPSPPGGAEELVARVVRVLPHDPRAFTQGLEYHGGKLYESTGLPGQSSLRRVDPDSGVVEQRVDLPAPLFAEGLARVGGLLYQLTWTDGRAMVWTLDGFRKEREFTYEGEGWGLCYDGKRLVMSDGSDRLTFRDPSTFAVLGRVAVRRGGVPLGRLNELECVDGVVYANIWQEPFIARIDPATGGVTAWIDASRLLSPAEAAGVDVLNGITWVPERGRFLLTGKYWPRVFEVEFVPRQAR